MKLLGNQSIWGGKAGRRTVARMPGDPAGRADGRFNAVETRFAIGYFRPVAPTADFQNTLPLRWPNARLRYRRYAVLIHCLAGWCFFQNDQSLKNVGC